MFKKILLLFVIVSFSYASYCYDTLSNDVQRFFQINLEGIGGTIRGIIGIALVLSVLYVFFLYIYSKITVDARLEVKAKEELREVIITALIVAGFFSLAYFLCEFFSMLFGEIVSGEGYLDYALSKFLELEQELKNTISYSYQQISEHAKMSRVVNSESSLWSYLNSARDPSGYLVKLSLCLALNFANLPGIATCGGISPISIIFYQYPHSFTYLRMYEKVVFYLNGYLLTIVGQRMFLEFVVRDFVLYLLPIGLLLRMLPPTRNAGNMLLIGVIGIYIIVPFLYALFFTSFYQNTTLVNDACEELPELSVFTACESPVSSINLGKFLPLGVLFPNLVLAFLITFFSAANRIFGGR